MAATAVGEGETGPLRLHFDRSVKLAFCGSSISSDGGLLLHRELDDAFGLTSLAANLIADPRVGKNGRHHLAGLLRQSIFSRLAGYEDVNDADRLRHDPVMRQLIGGGAVKRGAASASAMGFCPIAGPVGQRFSAIHGPRAGGQATSSVIGLVAAGKLTNKRSNGKCRLINRTSLESILRFSDR